MGNTIGFAAGMMGNTNALTGVDGQMPMPGSKSSTNGKDAGGFGGSFDTLLASRKADAATKADSLKTSAKSAMNSRDDAAARKDLTDQSSSADRKVQNRDAAEDASSKQSVKAEKAENATPDSEAENEVSKQDTVPYGEGLSKKTVVELGDDFSMLALLSQLTTEAMPQPEQMTQPMESPLLNVADSQMTIGSLQITAEMPAITEALQNLEGELTGKLAQSLQVTPEEVGNLISQLGLTQADLLDADKLQNVVLEGLEVPDTLALLSDETKCNAFTEIMATLQNGLQEVAAQADVEPDTLRHLIDQRNGLVEAVNGEGGEDAEQLITQEGGSLGAIAMVRGKNQQKDAEDFQQSGNGSFAQQMQNFSDDSIQVAEPQVQMPQNLEQTREIANQILDYMKAQIKPDVSSVEMQLHPASLGNLQIHIANKGGVVTASFIAQNDQVRAALEGQMVQLQQRFEDQGIKVQAIEVMVSTNSFAQSPQQGQSSQGQEPSQEGRSKGPRRIDLNGNLGSLDLEDMTAEEKLTAEMMKANGSTVDYMA